MKNSQIWTFFLQVTAHSYPSLSHRLDNFVLEGSDTKIFIKSECMDQEDCDFRQTEFMNNSQSFEQDIACDLKQEIKVEQDPYETNQNSIFEQETFVTSNLEYEEDPLKL